MAFRRDIQARASEDRLEKLIQLRLNSGPDKEIIDRRIWDLFGEEWCVMFTDLSGFSRNVAKFGIIHFLQTIYESERLLVPIIEKFDGILLKVEGDSFLVIFRKVDKAIHAAIEMQNILLGHNKMKPDEEKVLLCVGLGFGRVLEIGDSDVFGPEVNFASKLGEDTAKPYEILVTRSVKDEAKEIKRISFERIEDTPPGADEVFKLVFSLGADPKSQHTKPGKKSFRKAN